MREVIFFIASLAGAAILTALAIIVHPGLFWRWVLWSGIAIFTACALVLVIDYFRPGSPKILLAGIGVGFALVIACAIGFIFLPAVQRGALEDLSNPALKKAVTD